MSLNDVSQDTALRDAGHPAVIARLIHDFDLSPKKGMGQNFFSDSMLLDKIAESAELTAEDTVVEIGPGLGALTQRLCERAGKVVCIELDDRLTGVLETTLSDYDNYIIHIGDFLKLTDKKLMELTGTEKIKIVSNLPYCSTTPILQKLMLSSLDIESITVLVQKEAAERVTAEPSDKQYTVTAMMSEYYSEAKCLFDVPPESFFPRPSVTSTLVRFVMKRPRPEPACGQADLWKVAKASIAMRRKTLNNNLKTAGFSQETINTALESCGIQPQVRAETLSIYELADLACALCEK